MTIREFVIRTDPARIDAAIDVVRAVPTEVDKYGEWNPFTPRARADFTIGSPAHLPVRMGLATFRIGENVCAFDADLRSNPLTLVDFKGSRFHAEQQPAQHAQHDGQPIQGGSD